MTVQELRHRWREIKNRPKEDSERQDVYQQLFYQFHLASQALECGATVFDQRDGPAATKQGSRFKRR